MSLNCAEIDLVLKELDLEGSFIQNIIQPSYDTIAFYTYKHAELGRTVLVCLAPGVCRIHETRRKVPRNDKPLRFMEFLRSRIKGARIEEALQLNNDRIIRFTLTHGGDTFYLYIRLWSGAGNIIVTDVNNTILDVFYRRPKKGEVTGETWMPSEPAPPKAGTETCAKATAETCAKATAETCAKATTETCAKATTETCAKATAETCAKATAENSGDASARVWSVRELPGEGFFNEKIDSWYGEHAKTLSREALIEEARRRFDTRRSRLESALAKLEKKRIDFLGADRYRHQGDLLSANLWAIKPGMISVELEDYENDNRPILISLDPKIKPQENAALCYERYKKAVSGLADLEDDIASARRTLETLATELAAMEAEPNPHVIHKLLRRQNTPKQQIKKKYPGLVYRKAGWLILVGRTAAENDELLRHHVKGFDMWLHTRDWPGGYVFVKNRPGKSVPLEILLDAGTLALFYSKGRKAGTADLYYTQVKYLRRAKNAPKGTVLPTHEKNIHVSLDELRLKELETCRDEEI